ncbi:hypothetical protein NsoK4_00820 [Nitrosopumilus sp. K4]|uniref:hypothetical protein n=1 Tax=Nitrosopumilus sp. K4 TaxID=2795383 RepID=UPI001BABF237|nr:hypothetical protein [Nitrosopumilus sp. K4]QUC64860.1 hypothetical protein NsoK4_00820 [Nitrosopumilus sp. K4]
MPVKLNEHHIIPPEGTKDYEIFTKFKQVTIDFIDEIYEKGFLRKQFTEEEEVLTEIITERINVEAQSIAKLEQLMISEQRDLFFSDCKKYGILEIDVMNYYMASYTHQLLDIIERFKKYLLATLDKQAIGLRDNPTLGDIFTKLEHKKISHNFDEIMDNKLRNALGHGSYYWKNSTLHYTIDPEYKRTRTLSLGELYVITRKIAVVSNAFNSVAFDRILEIRRNHVPKENT